MNSALGRGVLVAVLVLGATAGHAHTLASTIVSVTMTHHNRVTITIAAEADPLIAKLEALAGVSASGRSPPLANVAHESNHCFPRCGRISMRASPAHRSCSTFRTSRSTTPRKRKSI
jgi:hypothetical protein